MPEPTIPPALTPSPRDGELIDVVQEMADSIRADRSMGVGETSIAYGLRRRFGPLLRPLLELLPPPEDAR